MKLTFLPTLFQPLIEKKIEIRSFDLKEEVYSMAIFSQHSKQTQVDFRKYNIETPNRKVPFALPSRIKAQLLCLAKSIGLDTGSADFIYTKEGAFIFLEINPVGKFAMTSSPCNYYLEKKVAAYLKKAITL